MTTALVLGRLALAAVLAVAGVAKLADRDGSADAARGLGVPRRLAPAVALLLPSLELALAAGLLAGPTARGACLAALAVLTAFTAATAAVLVRGEGVSCHCFGRLSAAPLRPSALARNGVLLALALALVTAPGAPGPGLGTWLGTLSGAGRLAVALGVALVAVTASGAWLVLELLRRHGRLLERLDALDPHDRAPMPEGTRLEVGAVAPPFALPAWDGGEVELDALLDEGLPVAVVFTDADCGPCREAIPELARLQRELGDRVTVAVVSRGTTSGTEADWREHELGRVAIAAGPDLWLAYGVAGSPGAVLVSRDGLVASTPVLGIGSIRQLLADAAPAGRAAALSVHGR